MSQQRLALQVLVALNELLRGFATSRSGCEHVIGLVKDDPDHLYNGLLSALLRLVFTLYAEDRDLFAHDEVWEQNYSLGGLFERLRDDAALFPDTMDDRYGAWGQLLALWRLIYGGGRHGQLELVARRGQLLIPTVSHFSKDAWSSRMRPWCRRSPMKLFGGFSAR